MKLVLLFVAFILAACSDSDDTNFLDVSKFEDYSDTQTLNIDWSEEGTSLSVVAYGLDSLFNETSSKVLRLDTGEKQHYHPSYTSHYLYVNITEAKIPSKYVLVQLQKSYDDYKDSVFTLEYFVEQNTPIKDRDYLVEPAINLCSHVVQKRAIRLVKDGYPYLPAQIIARNDLKLFLGDSLCDESTLKSKIFTKQPDMYELNKFSVDLADGVIDNASLH